MTTTPNIRAALDTFQQAANWGLDVHLSSAIVQELREALEAELETPSDEEIANLAEEFCGDPLPTVRRALELWGTPATPPAPAPSFEALAVRPLLEQVAAMADCIGAQTVGEITAISSRAAAWLRGNPPGRPVAIEPRGCPTPGACSCVEPAPPAPEPGEGPSDDQLDLVVIAIQALAPHQPDATTHDLNAVDRGREILRQSFARWGNPAAAPAPQPGVVL